MYSPATPRVALFHCDISRDHDTARVQALGELDLDAVPRLRAEVDALRAVGVRRIILDLSELDFIDSSGLRGILQYDAEARQDGFSLDLIPGSPAIQRVFELTDTLSRLSFMDPYSLRSV